MPDAAPGPVLDDLDVALLSSLHAHPRISDMELSRVARVARATVQSRLRRLQDAGVISSWAPEVDIAAAGFPVQAFVTLGSADVLCKVATASHADLQVTLLRINGSPAVVRSTSVVALSVLIAPRIMPLLESGGSAGGGRAPAYRRR